MEKVIRVNGHTFKVEKTSKWTSTAFDKNGKKVAAGPSIPKITSKLEELYPKVEKTRVPKETFIADNGKVKVMSMRQLTLSGFLAGESDEEVLKSIKLHFPNSKYNNSHVKWYRSNFAKSGDIPPEFAPKGSKAYKDWAEENKV